MKKILFSGLLVLFCTISVVAQNDTLSVREVILQLNSRLRNVDLLRAQKDKAEENTYKFYDTIINQFFDTVLLKQKMEDETSVFSAVGKIDFLRFLLNQYHWYLFITPDGLLIIKNERAKNEIDSLCFVSVTYTMHKEKMDFGFWVNSTNNKITALTNSAFTFQGREEEIKSLNSKIHK